MRAVVRTVGELLITAGAILLLFAAYQLWWTNVLASQASARNADRIRTQWEAAPPSSQVAAQTPPTGAGIGLMTIPRLGDSVKEMPVLQGVTLEVLAQGIGHYENTALPGQRGNFAVAGHRATNGEPFRDVDQLRPGDLVFVQTQDRWWTYRLVDDRIVDPFASWVIEPNPLPSAATPSDRLITLTTCNPRWGSTERWIWWGELVAERPSTDGPPALAVSG
jgi:sortase A